ncbi:tripartite tricarboxylate transporter substrate binding protein [Lutibaculum baratangense]|uniref:Putative exported protein n=1 Tax=Lutibaculum baratangense AMV1 TaxID=631454 RepID=V4RUW2_9HYPH|nr:tripartite tricarboxylate transporter substrate binding protein [Lutibaculum baratangense]ESR26855.1 putative exported protein [Lutibaculum baratangense AMV1]
MTTRRQALTFGAAALAVALAAPGVATAQDYPTKPIQMIVPFGQGGATDQVARLMAPVLEQELGKQVIIVNQPGAGGAVGLANLTRARPDGYTIAIGSDSTLAARPMMSDTGYDASSFEMIARIVEIPSGIAVRADSEYQTLNDLVEAAKTEQLTYSGSGVASGPHLAAAVFLAEAGVDATFVNSNSNQEGLVKLLSGEVDFLTGGGSNFPALFDESGNSDIRVLGLAAEERWPYMPDVPTFKEQGYDYLRSQWFGMVAPAGTPDEAVQKLASAVETLVESEEFKARLEEFYFNPAYQGPDEMRAQIEEEAQSMRPVLEKLDLLKK